ncbi:MAG: CoA-binding protein [Deltaproteobacteria bacterium]|nr:MAG: CoA-binding protein [Deltaproteobacteria bacterium]
MRPEERAELDRMFNPRGLALFGGVSTAFSFGQLVVLSQLRYGYKGGFYPISEKGGEISGFKIYRSLGEVRGPVDLAAISVPAKAVPAVLHECLDHGVAGVQIHSAGFSETGEEQGAALEAEVARIGANGLRVLGPNCFGIHSPRAGITLLPGHGFSQEPGPVALISQSGGVATEFGYEAQFMGLGLSKVISYGNGCDLDAVELLDYLADDPETGYIAAYLEGVKDGRRFLEILRSAARRKPVVLWKAGLTPLGSRAALSHTGSMAGEDMVWEGVLTQAGAASVQGLDQMMDTLVALKYLKNRGRRIALLGGGGALGVFGSDLAYHWGLEIPKFSEETQKRLKVFFPAPGNSMANPLDTGSPAVPTETVQALAREILTREPVDVLIIIMLLRTLEVDLPTFSGMNEQEPPPRGSYLQSLVEPLAQLREETGKDLVMVLNNRTYQPEDVGVEALSRQMRQRFQEVGIPVYSSTERALCGMSYALTTRLGHKR